MEHFATDVRHGLTRLLAAPAFSALVALTLAMGIGAATSIFSVIHAVLVNPYPYVDAHDIFVFQIRYPNRPRGSDRAFLMGAEMAAFRSGVPAAGDLAFLESDLNVVQATDEGSRKLNGALASSRTFPFFGVDALVGRTLTPDDSRPDAEPVFVLSHGAWARYYGRSRDVVGRTFTLNGVRTTLVGIMPPRFTLLGADVWQPMTIEPPASDTAGRAYSYFVRLAPGATVEQAEAQFRVVADRLAAEYPWLYGEGFTVRAASLIDNTVGALRSTLYTFAAATGLLLLIACSNVANMLLARASTREREMAIRGSIGGTRTRLVRQLLTEGILLAIPAGIAGVGIAYACLETITVLVPPSRIPGEAVVGLNWQALLFCFALSVATTLIFGVVPALQATRRSLTDLQRGMAADRGSCATGLRGSLVVAEVALSLILLASAGLLVRSYVSLQQTDLGFRANNLLFARFAMPEERYQSSAVKQQLFDEIVSRLEALPSVSGVAVASQFPLGGGIRTGIDVTGRPHEETFPTLIQLGTASYFSTTGVRLLRGRLFSDDDFRSGRQVAVVNEAFVGRYFDGSDPIGREISATDPGRMLRAGGLNNQSFEVVGVVADMKNRGPRDASWPEAFVPLWLAPGLGRVVLIGTNDDPARLANALRDEIWAVDRTLVIEETASVSDILGRYHYAEPRFSIAILAAFASCGLVLIVLGVYGVVADIVAREKYAIAVRMAVGASPRQVLSMVFSRALRLIGTGIAIGSVGTVFATRVLAARLSGVTPNDPATLGAAIVLIVVVGLAASLFPARQAARTDSVAGLRSGP